MYFEDTFYKKGDEFSYEGRFITTRYKNDDGFVIGVFSPKSSKAPDIVCKGIVPGYIQGAPYRITGKVIEDKTWGLQVNITLAESVVPTSKDDIVAFLGSGAVPGIGPVTAKNIYKKFGAETLDILQNEPHRLSEVSGIGPKTAAKLEKSIPTVLENREIIGYFAKFGISITTINRLIREYGSRTKHIIKNNPYILCKVRGFAFTRADQIAMKLGTSKYDENRLEAGIVATLRYVCEHEGGHTLLPREMLLESVYKKLEVSETEPVIAALNKLLKERKIIEDDKGIHLKHLYYAEKNILRCVDNNSHSSYLLDEDELVDNQKTSSKRLGIDLTEEQLGAVSNAFSCNISILTGKAGTGKTASCKMIVDIAKFCDIPICLISPTGRAAKHLADVCGSANGYTIHRALAMKIRQSKDDDFFSDDVVVTNPSRKTSEAEQCFKKAQIVIADEASMMDTEMASILLMACQDKNLVLVGDPFQLPSIGPGRVLGDLIDTHAVPVTMLTKIFRQADGSPIIDAANKVREGKSPCYEKGVIFYETDNAHVLDVFQENIVPIIENENLGYEDFMVMSPIKKTPYSGVNALNAFLRPICNKKFTYTGDEKKDAKLQVGDYVAQKKNNYEVDIFNGDIGVIEYIDSEGSVGVSFSGSEDLIEFESDEVNDNLMLAYASSVHKQQGSQAPTAVIVCTMSHFSLLNRNLLYTAITRAENRLILVGEKKAFAMAASNATENKRITGLS